MKTPREARVFTIHRTMPRRRESALSDQYDHYRDAHFRNMALVRDDLASVKVMRQALKEWYTDHYRRGGTWEGTQSASVYVGGNINETLTVPQWSDYIFTWERELLEERDLSFSYFEHYMSHGN